MSSDARPTFTWLGHATVRFVLPGGEVVLIDPFLEGNPSCPDAGKRVERLDLILVTHAHSDHMGDVVRLARQHRCPVIGTFDLCQWFSSQGVEKVSGMNLGGTQTALGLRISMVRADHSSGFVHDGQMVYGGVAAGYVVRMPGGFTFYHAGDTDVFSDMALIGELDRPDLALLPIGGFYTMDPARAARACELLRVPRVIPMHWGTFPILAGTPDELRREIAGRGLSTEVIALEPGESWP